MDEWSTLIVNTLGEEFKTYSHDIAYLLLCLNEGVKPGFLWDYSDMPTEKLKSLLMLFNAKGFINKNIVMLSIDEDTLIINLDTVTRNFSGYLGNTHSWLIDITKPEPKIATAEIHSSFVELIRSLLEQLGMTKSKESDQAANDENKTAPSHGGIVYKIKLPESANVSTVFGMILGNPQIYWWNSSADGSTLSGMPLKIYNFNAKCKLLPDNDNELELFSFSIPEALEGKIKIHIQQWGNVAYTRVKNSTTFYDPSFRCDEMLCLQVSV